MKYHAINCDSIQGPTPNSIPDTKTTVVTNSKPATAPNSWVTTMTIEVTGFMFGKNCKYTREAIHTAESIATHAI